LRTVNVPPLTSGLQVLFGVVSGTTVSSRGEEYVASGGTAIGARLKGGYDVVFGSAVSATVSSGTQYVFGVAAATTVSSGGLQVVESGASATGATRNESNRGQAQDRARPAARRGRTSRFKAEAARRDSDGSIVNRPLTS
jgi:autotransporter passenger strand-loop-strand repeat protein